MLVDILLSTYNGEKYIEELFESLISQTYGDWKIIIRDDGSTDNTINKINTFVKKNPSKVVLINDEEGNIGYTKSFMKLLSCSGSDYIMFCDQDDVWKSNKIEDLLKLIREKETKLNNQITPHLAFSDLTVVNQTLEVIYGSFLNHIGFKKNKGQQIHLLKNYTPGCNIIFNRSLKEFSLQTENLVGLHDFWLVILAACIGKISYTNQSLMLYRIHESNSIGIKVNKVNNVKDLEIFLKNILKFVFNNVEYRKNLYNNNLLQINEFNNKFPELISDEGKFLANISDSNLFVRKFYNINKPFILHEKVLDQITYILCF